MSSTSEIPEPVELTVTSAHIKEAIATFRDYFSYHPELAKVSDAEIEKAVTERLAGLQAAPRDLTINLWARQKVALEWDCPFAVGHVIFDTIIVILGFAHLHLPPGWGGAQTATRDIATWVAKNQTQWDTLVKNLQKADTTYTKAAAIFAIGSNAYTVGMFGGILSSIVSSMSAWEWIVCGVNALAQLIALIGSSGVAFIAQLVLQAIALEGLVEDSTNAVNVCSASPPPSPPTPPEWPEERHEGKFGGNGGIPFIDPAPAGATLLGVRVRCGEYVNLIQSIWNTGVAPAVGPRHGTESGDDYYIQLSPDEFLFCVTGKCGQYMNQIAFHTNKRETIGPFGGGEGVDFRFEAPHGEGVQYQIAGFFGRSGDWVDQIGFICRKRHES